MTPLTEVRGVLHLGIPGLRVKLLVHNQDDKLGAVYVF